MKICLVVRKENKKIRNATVCKSNNITFKSQLEKTLYNVLIQEGFNPQYEPKTFTLIAGFESKIPFYDKETDNQFNKRRESGDKTAKKLVKKSSNIQGIRYTPDFYFKYNELNVYIEAKGKENDCFYLKKKLFIRYLNQQPDNSIYFEIYTKKQLLQAIDILKEYEKSITENRRIDSVSTSKGL